MAFSQLRKRCCECKKLVIVSELRMHKGYFYCNDCFTIMNRTYTDTKSEIFRQAALKISRGEVDEDKNKLSISEKETKISLPDNISDTLNSIKDESKSSNEAAVLLEKQLSEQMLLQAIGYPYKEEKSIFVKSPQGQWLNVKKEIVTKRMPGNSQLFIMFMTNKFPKLWKVSKELIHSKDEGYDSEPSKRNRKQIESLARQILEADSDKS